MFHHFKTRDAIFAAVIGWIVEDLLKAIRTVLFFDLLHPESQRLKAALPQVTDHYIE